MSERLMLMSLRIIGLSFEVGEASLYLERALDLSRLTGFSKARARPSSDQLVIGRVLEVSPDRRIYTIVPPSVAWPWIFRRRVDPAEELEIERAIIWASRGASKRRAAFRSDPEREFADAVHTERMRQSLLENHRQAAERLAGGHRFPVIDHLPTPAPAREGLSAVRDQRGCRRPSREDVYLPARHLWPKLAEIQQISDLPDRPAVLKLRTFLLRALKSQSILKLLRL